MSKVVVLDAGPTGIFVNPKSHGLPVAARQWAADLLAAGCRIVLPEISDYEVRRELIRGGLTRSLLLLDSLARQVEYLPIATPHMRDAADLWAQARQAGRPTAPDPALDGDVILAAQARSLGVPFVVATTNAAHLSRYVPAADWLTITP